MARLGERGKSKISGLTVTMFLVTAVCFAVVGIVQLYYDPILGPHLEKVSITKRLVTIKAGDPDSAYD